MFCYDDSTHQNKTNSNFQLLFTKYFHLKDGWTNFIGCKHEVYDTEGCFIQNYNYIKRSFLKGCQQTTLLWNVFNIL